MRRLRRATSFAGFAVLFAPQPALAHPHILIDARAIVRFDSQGEAVSLRNIWTFDPAFSAYAIQGYDSKGDGRPTRRDLQPLAEINVRSLAVYGFFTQVFLGKKSVAFDPPRDYFDDFSNEALTLQFTLPFKTPVSAMGKNLKIEVYDPEYFAAIKFAAKTPVTLKGADACAIEIQRPAPLDAGLASQLAIIPANQRQLPAALFNVTSKLVNGALIQCR